MAYANILELTHPRRLTMLLNPKKHVSGCSDEQSKEIMRKTINFFETKGKRKLKQDDHERVWYADFLEFVKKENIFHVYALKGSYTMTD
jgi:acyl-CoA dehydrogenase